MERRLDPTRLGDHPTGSTGPPVDQVVVEGTNGSDVVSAEGRNGSAGVSGLAALVSVTGVEPARDILTIDPLDGDDVVEASALAANGGPSASS